MEGTGSLTSERCDRYWRGWSSLGMLAEGCMSYTRCGLYEVSKTPVWSSSIWACRRGVAMSFERR